VLSVADWNNCCNLCFYICIRTANTTTQQTVCSVSVHCIVQTFMVHWYLLLCVKYWMFQGKSVIRLAVQPLVDIYGSVHRSMTQ
jgi:hypothetical protein